jgi:hypothetical protein
MEEYDVEEGEDPDEYFDEDDVRERAKEIAQEHGYESESGKLLEFFEALQQASYGYDDVDVGQAISEVMEDSYGGIRASELIDKLRKSDGIAHATDDEGNLSSTELIREALERMGFDGVIDRTVPEKFGPKRKMGRSMEGMTEDTVHYIAFEPNQIKSAIGNKGTFDPDDPKMVKDILLGLDWFLRSKERIAQIDMPDPAGIRGRERHSIRLTLASGDRQYVDKLPEGTKPGHLFDTKTGKVSVPEEAPSHFLRRVLANITSVGELETTLSSLPSGDKERLKQSVKEINENYLQQFEDMPRLYHGTTSDIARKIKESGFRLTEGRRSGFLGAERRVKNQAIFLSDDKGFARAYGANRDPYGGADTEVLEVRANIKNTLDMRKWGGHIPKDLRKLMLKKLSDYEGEEVKRPKQEDMFWLLDQPEVIQMMKKLGYDSARISESRATRRALGIRSGSTMAVLDPKNLHIPKPPLHTLEDLLELVREDRQEKPKVTKQQIVSKYPKVREGKSDGRIVREEIPNLGSISASLENYEEVPGIRDIPLSEFELSGKSYDKSGTDRIKELAEEIKQSGEINPLIVVMDEEGLYILEGGHRSEALYRLGAKSLPAKLVIDMDSVELSEEEGESGSGPEDKKKEAEKLMQPGDLQWKKPDFVEEVGEYFENDHTKKEFAKRGLKFKDERELADFMEKHGKRVKISREDLAKNPVNLTLNPKDFKEELESDPEYAQSYKDMKKKMQEEGVNLPSPIIFKFGDEYYGFAGNRRMNLAFESGKDLDVYLVDVPQQENKTKEAEELWKKEGVKSPYFKEWFGDWENAPENASKVVDDEGKPLVVYHGTDVEFDEFDRKKAGAGNDKGMRGKGFYFSPNKKTAQGYGDKLIGVYVDIKTPFRPSDFSSKEEIADKLGISERNFVFDKDSGEFRVYQPFSSSLTSALIEAGYDGVIYPNSQEIIAFSPDQIKSVNNKGTFDPDDSNINKENTSFFSDVVSGLLHLLKGKKKKKKKRKKDLEIVPPEREGTDLSVHGTSIDIIPLMEDQSKDVLLGLEYVLKEKELITRIDPPDPTGQMGRERDSFRILTATGKRYYVKPLPKGAKPGRLFDPETKKIYSPKEEGSKEKKTSKEEYKPTDHERFLNQTGKLGDTYAEMSVEDSIQNFDTMLKKLYDVAEEMEGQGDLSELLYDYLESLEDNVKSGKKKTAIQRLRLDTKHNLSGFFPKPMNLLEFDDEAVEKARKGLLAPIVQSKDISDEGSSIVDDVLTADGWEGIHKSGGNHTTEKRSHELGAFALSRAVKFGNVLPTFLHPGDGDRYEGTIQQKTPGDTVMRMDVRQIDRAMLEPIAAFHEVVMQRDGHLGNVRVDLKTNTGYAIDHGDALEKMGNPESRDEFAYSDVFETLAARARDATGIDEMPVLLHPDLVRRCREANLEQAEEEMAKAGVDPTTIQGSLYRVRKMAKNGTIPMPGE